MNEALQWFVIAALAIAVAILVRETRRLARLRREIGRRLTLVERACVEERRRAVLDDVRRFLRDAGRQPRGDLACRAQGLEDCYLWLLFRPLGNGRFIEAGASDGVRNSVTWLFEAVGWTGILVEANPDAAAACARNRLASHTVHAALGPRTRAPRRRSSDSEAGATPTTCPSCPRWPASAARTSNVPRRQSGSRSPCAP